jgi:homoserine O-acetyltransferase
MGVCQEFYKREAWREIGFKSLDDFLCRFWEAYFAPMDPNNLIWMASKWRYGDVSKHTGGDLARALSMIQAKTHVIAFSRDMFFPPADCEEEQKLIPGSKFKLIQSLWAHFTMFCLTPADKAQIDACISDILREKA